MPPSGQSSQGGPSGPGGQANQENYKGFGMAHHFMPLAHVVVGAHCTWSLRLNTIPQRIPGRKIQSRYSKGLYISSPRGF